MYPSTKEGNFGIIKIEFIWIIVNRFLSTETTCAQNKMNEMTWN